MKHKDFVDLESSTRDSKNIEKNSNLPTLALVVPCYNEQAVLPLSINAMRQKMDELIAKRVAKDSFICFVDDGSSDKTWAILREATKHTRTHITATENPQIKENLDSKKLSNSQVQMCAIKLSKNYGHQNALLAGLEYVKDKCDCAISIDCDLQDDINALPSFISKFKNGAEVVYGVRTSRKSDSFFKKYSAIGFYKLMNFMGVKILHNSADYRLLSARAIRALSEFKEVNLFLRGIVPLLGFKSDIVHFERFSRAAGDSKYPLTKMLSFAWNGITSFSIMPLRMISVLGGVFFALSLLLLSYALFVKFFTAKAIAGWASIIIPLCFFGGINMLSLGIIGEYIGKIYTEIKHRPRYFIEEVVGFKHSK